MQGQGSYTESKERAYHGIFTINLAVARKSHHKYHHFDLNAGCGYNYAAECDGSPLVFLDAARDLGVDNFAAHFVDHDPLAVDELLARLLGDRHSTIHQGDNREFVSAIPDLIRQHGGEPGKALGSVLCDPNGTDLPWRELSVLSRKCPRLDFILNYPARAWKRARAAGCECGQVFLEDLLRSLNKRHWQTQSPESSDPHEWMILVGRNYEIGNWAAKRFYKLNTPQGRDCLRRSLTRDETTYSLF